MYCLISTINFFSVSIKLSLDTPPDACLCPPPLKYLAANILTLKSPLDLNEIFIIPSSFFSIKRTEQRMPETLKPKFTSHL